MHSDAVDSPFRDHDPEIMTSRGSFQFWQNPQVPLRGSTGSRNPVALLLPVEVSRTIALQNSLSVFVASSGSSGFAPDYNVSATAKGMQRIMESLKIQGHGIRILKSSGGDDIHDGIGIEFHRNSIVAFEMPNPGKQFERALIELKRFQKEEPWNFTWRKPFNSGRQTNRGTGKVYRDDGAIPE
jgi:hypothetical protein